MAQSRRLGQRAAPGGAALRVRCRQRTGAWVGTTVGAGRTDLWGAGPAGLGVEVLEVPSDEECSAEGGCCNGRRWQRRADDGTPLGRESLGPISEWDHCWWG